MDLATFCLFNFLLAKVSVYGTNCFFYGGLMYSFTVMQSKRFIELAQVQQINDEKCFFLMQNPSQNP